MRSMLLLSLTALGLIAAGAAQASLLVDRGLPTDNLNNAAGPNRSNVTWAFGSYPPYAWFVGDDFALGTSSSITDIRTWFTPSGDANVPSPTLFLGTVDGTLSQVAARTTVTKVPYANNEGYETGTSGVYRDLYQVDFSFTDLTLSAGTYSFAVEGSPPLANGNPSFFEHASSAGYSGSIQQGADGSLDYYYNDPSADGSLYFDGTWSSLGNGWDKPSDLNIQVFGAPVPEPASMGILGMGLLGLVVTRIRKRQTD